MARVFVRLFIIITLLSLDCGEGKLGPAQEQLHQNRKQWQEQLHENQKRWASQKVSSYQYQMWVICFCPDEITRPVNVEVRNGVTRRVVYEDSGEPATNQLFKNIDTVEKLFGTIENAINEKVDEIAVTYDLVYGYPVSIRIDYLKGAVDDEIAYKMSDFKVR